MDGELLCAVNSIYFVMPSITHIVNSFNQSTLYRETYMLMKLTPKPSSSSMCYNRTVMIAAGMMCTVLLFPHSHSWLPLVDHCGISDSSASSSNRLSTLPKIILNNIFPYLEHQAKHESTTHLPTES